MLHIKEADNDRWQEWVDLHLRSGWWRRWMQDTGISAADLAHTPLPHYLYCEEPELDEIDEIEMDLAWRDACQSPVWHVNEYLLDQSLGGNQEGGWYFPTGAFQSCHLTTTDYDEARRLAAELERGPLAQANAGRPAISSVLSRGRYQVRVESSPGRDFPDCPPAYE